MSDRVFLDTNIIVYLFDGRFPEKRRAAGQLLKGLANKSVIPVVSTQVLQEAYSALTRKLKMDPADVMAALQMLEGASFLTGIIDVPLMWRGAARSIQEKLSFWDALIVESACSAQCTLLYTEDLQDGRLFGELVVRNPFNGQAEA